MIKQRLIRFKEGDELSESVNELLDYEIDNKKMNERLVEDIQFAELIRKTYEYRSLTEILIIMLSNDNAKEKQPIKIESTKPKSKHTIIDVDSTIDMLNNI